ncbi:hypothetical protein [Mycoplasma todarodis]|uniref:hypothetical protein n=1 Tax=Mycoplasma todarodis TaxID=1937191 RepID=UPI003B2A7B7F
MQTVEELEQEFWNKKVNQRFKNLKVSYIVLLVTTSIYLIGGIAIMFPGKNAVLTVILSTTLLFSSVVGVVMLVLGMINCSFIQRYNPDRNIKYHRITFIAAITTVCTFFLLSIILVFIQVGYHRGKSPISNNSFIAIRAVTSIALVGLLITYSIGLKKVMDILKNNEKIVKKDPIE